MSSLLNKSNVRKFLLDEAGKTRHHKFTRVGAEVYDEIEAELREWMRQKIAFLPSKGKTIS